MVAIFPQSNGTSEWSLRGDSIIAETLQRLEPYEMTPEEELEALPVTQHDIEWISLLIDAFKIQYGESWGGWQWQLKLWMYIQKWFDRPLYDDFLDSIVTILWYWRQDGELWNTVSVLHNASAAVRERERKMDEVSLAIIRSLPTEKEYMLWIKRFYTVVMGIPVKRMNVTQVRKAGSDISFLNYAKFTRGQWCTQTGWEWTPRVKSPEDILSAYMKLLWKQHQPTDDSSSDDSSSVVNAVYPFL